MASGKWSVLALVGIIAVTGCGGQGKDSSGDGKLQIVTTSTVYADIVQNIAGDAAEVTPIIDSTSEDPHSYEATAQDKLKIREADVVVLNGGGYDEFMTESAEGGDATVINAVKASGIEGSEDAADGGHEHEHEHEPGHAEFNEHVWYDLGAMKNLAHRMAEELAAKDSQDTETFRKNADDYASRIDDLRERAGKIDGSGKTYLATEPVPGYLLQEAGMTDATPEDFTEAIESESDVPAATLHAVTQQISRKSVSLVAFNAQTESAQTTSLKTEAADAGVPTVDFTETLPENTDYLGWMRQNIDHVQRALEHS